MQEHVGRWEQLKYLADISDALPSMAIHDNILKRGQVFLLPKNITSYTSIFLEPSNNSCLLNCLIAQYPALEQFI
jgi:hypothetical protein